ncbi:hypothetical protein AK812_SmicGene10101 [Symbiodinium microadriaticum]|uniref:Endonuclease/exonuclease/phosphatase domain-containing protein n=1 Tax=Symbiodinium microadriaticum TaxID=2951 RepID=A0A1Q9EGM6_SYMMI|nr:hypothetical protein AK812_SmicGene10101 [Symbiodinium microadriaticum]
MKHGMHGMDPIGGSGGVPVHHIHAIQPEAMPLKLPQGEKLPLTRGQDWRWVAGSLAACVVVALILYELSLRFPRSHFLDPATVSYRGHSASGAPGQQQWAEMKTWLAVEADKFCDILLAIMAIYQHGHRSDRAGVFSVLTKAVKQVPQRDTFIVAGDFNTSFSPTQSLEGPRTAQLADPRPDEANLTNLVSRLRLVARNTWHCRQCFTYEQGEARNQIDFIFTREPCGGSGAKQASPLVNFYLGSWN